MTLVKVQSEWNGTVIRHFTVRCRRNHVVARLQDGIHRMSVSIDHDGSRVTSIRGRVFEYPWTTCPEAAAKLSSFVGLDIRFEDRPKTIDQYSQCTHLMDLARLAVQNAARKGRRRYRLSARSLASQGDDSFEALAFIDERPVLSWTIVGSVVASPPPFAGLSMEGRAILPEWCRAQPEIVEATMMLIRCVKMLKMRKKTATFGVHDNPLGASPTIGACYTLQPDNIARARRPIFAASVRSDGPPPERTTRNSSPGR